MKRAWSIVLLSVALFAAFFPTSACFATVPLPAAHRVTIVLAPYLTWDDITPTSTPTLWKLAASGAVGDLNSRSRFSESNEPPPPLEGALTLSAGNWATPDLSAAAAFGATEPVAGEPARVVYRRLLGVPMGAAAIGYLGLPVEVRANSDAASGVTLGTLGQAVQDAGGSTVAVGNSDSGTASDTAKYERPAAVTAMDFRGLVDLGDVSPDTLRPSAEAPYGVETDVSAFSSALDRVDGSLAASKRTLVVLDPGDPYRARRFSGQVTEEVANSQAAAAVSKLDAVTALAVAHSGRGDLVIVASQALLSDRHRAMQGFGPIIVSGRGQSGYLVTSSTHRTGLVTNPDITATVLRAFNIRVPVQVVGDVMGGNGSRAPQGATERIAYLAALDETAVSIDAGRLAVLDGFEQLFVAMLLLVGLFAVSRRALGARAHKAAAVVLKTLVLVLLCVPVAGWLMFVFSASMSSASSASSLFVVSIVVLALVAIACWRFVGGRVPVLFLLLFTTTLLLIDQWFGAPLSLGNYFGYSTLQGARFYGIGNEAAGMIVGATIVGAALLIDQWAEASWIRPLRRYGLPVLGFAVVVTAAAPALGANVGVAIWGLAGFVVAWVLINGHRLTWKTAVLIAVLVVVAIGAFSLIDVLGRGEQTHLGRSLMSAQQGGVGQLVDIVARKAATNARVLGQSNWSGVLAVMLGFLAFLRLFVTRDFAKMLAENPAFGGAIAATLVAGVLAFFTEDSGIVVPAFIMLSTAAAAAWLILSVPPEAEDRS